MVVKIQFYKQTVKYTNKHNFLEYNLKWKYIYVL